MHEREIREKLEENGRKRKKERMRLEINDRKVSEK